MIFNMIFLALLNASPSQVLSEKVIELRQEVELLNDEYKTERERVLNEIKALSIQKAELMSNVRNEEIREKQLSDKINQLKKAMGESTVMSHELEPVIKENIKKFKTYIETSIPFKKQERLAAVDELQTKIDKKEISIIKAANQLWALFEDEKRLASETSLHRQSVLVGNKILLAEVAKLGMTFLYFKTESDQVGMALKVKGEWLFQTFDNAEKQKKVITFFESLKKQIRQGFFQLPTKI